MDILNSVDMRTKKLGEGVFLFVHGNIGIYVEKGIGRVAVLSGNNISEVGSMQDFEVSKVHYLEGKQMILQADENRMCIYDFELNENLFAGEKFYADDDCTYAVCLGESGNVLWCNDKGSRYFGAKDDAFVYESLSRITGITDGSSVEMISNILHRLEN